MGNISDKENTYSFWGHYVKGQGHRLWQGPTWLGQYSSLITQIGILSYSLDWGLAACLRLLLGLYSIWCVWTMKILMRLRICLTLIQSSLFRCMLSTVVACYSSNNDNQYWIKFWTKSPVAGIEFCSFIVSYLTWFWNILHQLFILFS